MMELRELALVVTSGAGTTQLDIKYRLDIPVWMTGCL